MCTYSGAYYRAVLHGVEAEDQERVVEALRTALV
jgi:hypothetical protein